MCLQFNTHIVFTILMITMVMDSLDLKVSAFSTWEKELHKIVFDHRYLLLTSKERKQMFEQYVKERAEKERWEKKNKLKEKKDQFRQLLEEARLHGRFALRLYCHHFLFIGLIFQIQIICFNH